MRKLSVEDFNNMDVIGSRILVERDAADDNVAGSTIIKAANTQHPPARATVVKTGLCRKLEKATVGFCVTEGDRILFSRNAGNEFTLEDGRRVLFLEEDHIYAKLPPEGCGFTFIHNGEEVEVPMAPLYERVVIKRDAADAASKGGILLPTEDKAHIGTVVVTGPGKLRQDGTIKPISVEIGDRVMYEKYSGTLVNEGGVEYLVVREADVIGVLEDQ